LVALWAKRNTLECVGWWLQETHTGKAENDLIFNSALGIAFSLWYKTVAGRFP